MGRKSGIAVRIESWKQRMPDRVWKLLCFVLSLCCLFGVAWLFQALGNVLLYSNKARFSVSLFSTLGTMCLLWYLLKRYSLIFWIPFMAYACGQMLTYWLYGAFVTHTLILAEIMEGTQDEIMAYVTPFNIGICCLLVLFSALLGYVLVCSMRPFKRLHLLGIGLICCLIVGSKFVGHGNKERTISSMWPLADIWRVYHNVEVAKAFNQGMSDDLRALPSPAEAPSALPTLKPDSGVVLVLHIGESVRADRLSLNGYLNQGRSTTPWLDSQKGTSLINFTDCISSSAFTAYAQMTLLTDATRAVSYAKEVDELGVNVDASVKPLSWARAGSVLDLFAANDFSIYSFQGKISRQNVRYEKIARMLTKSVKAWYHAANMPLENMPQIREVLSGHPNENLFFYINNEGSHVPFSFFEEPYAPFQPTHIEFSNPATNAELISNAYDNTIYYLDAYIRQVVEQLKGRPFIYIYVSDHGEYLGHDGMWGRGGITENYHSTGGSRVGMFIITSPEFEALHPHMAEAVQNLREHADMTVGHEHIYHTLLGLVGLETPYYDASLDLCSKSAKPYDGPQPKEKLVPDSLPASYQTKP